MRNNLVFMLPPKLFQKKQNKNNKNNNNNKKNPFRRGPGMRLWMHSHIHTHDMYIVGHQCECHSSFIIYEYN